MVYIKDYKYILGRRLRVIVYTCIFQAVDGGLRFTLSKDGKDDLSINNVSEEVV